MPDVHGRTRGSHATADVSAVSAVGMRRVRPRDCATDGAVANATGVHDDAESAAIAPNSLTAPKSKTPHALRGRPHCHNSTSLDRNFGSKVQSLERQIWSPSSLLLVLLVLLAAKVILLLPERRGGKKRGRRRRTQTDAAVSQASATLFSFSLSVWSFPLSLSLFLSALPSFLLPFSFFLFSAHPF